MFPGPSASILLFEKERLGEICLTCRRHRPFIRDRTPRLPLQ
jgi:hypothetical protein